MMNISGVYALITQNTSGVLSTGAVNIKIRTYKLNSENAEVEYNDDDVLNPGEETSFIPRVSNLGADCYLRVKINYNNTDFSQYVTGLSTHLNKYGEYYYYDKVLNTNETLKLFDTIKIPDNAAALSNNGKLDIEIIAEAMQENNFEPDYMLEDPWKGIIPTENVTNSYSIDTNNNDNIIIRYENNTDKNIFVPNNFLESIKDAMPGDSVTESIDIKNISEENIRYYLKLDLDEYSEKEAELLNKLNLTITNKTGEVLYNGKLLSEDNIPLGEYALNESDTLEFKISVPIDLPNEYSNLNPKLSLNFTSSSKKNSESGNGGTNSTTRIEENTRIITNEQKITNNSDNSKNKNNIIKSITNPNTGDRIDMAITIFILSSIGLAATMILDFILRKKENI